LKTKSQFVIKRWTKSTYNSFKAI